MNLYITHIQVQGCPVIIEARTAAQAIKAEKVLQAVLAQSGISFGIPVPTTPSGQSRADPLSPPAP